MTHRTARPLTPASIALALALLMAAVGATPPAAAPSTTGSAKSSPATSLLFLQEAGGGRIVKLGRDRYRLRLHPVSRRVSTFTDRPRRRAGQQGIRHFVSGWRRFGFARVAPNAALVVHHAPASRDVAMVTLSRPHYDARRNTLSYVARPLHGSSTADLAAFAKRGDPLRPRRFGAASLFIDSSGTEITYQRVSLEVSGMPAGQPLSIWLSGGSSAGRIAWSCGPDLLVGAGSCVRVRTLSGNLPIFQFEVTGRRLVLITAAGDGTATYGITLYLVASGRPGTFYLEAQRPPGTTVTAQIGEGALGLVNETPTPFAWYAP